MVKLKSVFFIFSFFFASLSFANSINVVSELDRESVPINGSFIWSVNVSFEGDTPKIFVPTPQSTDFEILSRWTERQSSTSIINGKITRSNSQNYKYRLQPKAKGKLRLESVTVKVNGKDYKTEELFIEVGEEDKNFSNSPNNRIQIGNSLFGNNPLMQPFTNSINRPFFNSLEGLSTSRFTVETDKREVYKGQALQVNWILLLSAFIRYEIDKRSKLEGFWKEELLTNQQPKFLGNVLVGQTPMKKILFDSVILFPLKEGQLFIDPYSVRLSSVSSTVKKTKSIPITVKPLPIDSKNVFSGAVGDFKVSWSVQGSDFKMNEPISLIMSFEGDGHPQFIQSPKIKWPQSLTIYDPVEKSKFQSTGKSFKNYEWILIPKQGGVITIPSIEISTFNPKQGKYIYHTLPELKLNVVQGKENVSEDINFFGEEKKDSSLSEKKKNYFSNLSLFKHAHLKMIWMLSSLIFFILFCITIAMRFKKQNKKTVLKTVSKKMQEIDQLIQKGRWQEAAVKITNLCYFIFYQVDTSSNAENWETLIKNWPPSLYQKYGQQIEDLMKKLEHLSFGVSNQSNPARLKEIKEIYIQAKELINHLVSLI